MVWSDIKKASNEALVNGLSMMSPCGPREKQALLEAKDLKSRAEMLVAITTIELGARAGRGDADSWADCICAACRSDFRRLASEAKQRASRPHSAASRRAA